jgi:hypothetical protein
MRRFASPPERLREGLEEVPHERARNDEMAPEKKRSKQIMRAA